MSARVFNPMVMSEFRRSTTPLNGPAVNRVRKNLFGPVNHEDRREFVDRELATLSKLDMEKWEFNFITEEPLNTASSRFLWERVVPQESIIEAYALRRLPYLSKSSTVSQDEKSSSSKTSSPATVKTRSHQSQITDFLKTRKRPSSAPSTSIKVGEKLQRTVPSTLETSSDPSVVRKMRRTTSTPSTTTTTTVTPSSMSTGTS